MLSFLEGDAGVMTMGTMPVAARATVSALVASSAAAHQGQKRPGWSEGAGTGWSAHHKISQL
jgi:hypothetical protein